MNGIGRLIRRLRDERGITRNELANGLCSSKYIYLLEMGKRLPSMIIIKGIAEKLDVDLFEFIPYLDCEDPVAVKKIIDEFSRCRINSDFTGLEEATIQAEQLKDFYIEPWISEVTFYKVTLSLLSSGDHDKALYMVKENIEKHGGSVPILEKDLSKASEMLIRFYNLLSVYYVVIGEFKTARVYHESLHDKLVEKRHMDEYQSVYISLTMNYMNCLNTFEEYRKVIEIGEELIVFLFSISVLDRIHLTYYLLSQSHYALGHTEMAHELIRKCIYLGLGLNKTQDLNIILKNPILLEFDRNGALAVDLSNQIEEL